MVMLIVTPCHAENFRSRTLNEPPHGRILDATHLAATPLLESVPWADVGRKGGIFIQLDEIFLESIKLK